MLLAAAAMGKIDVHRIWERLEKLQWRKRVEEESKTTPEERYHLSKCCSPVPGDPILGYHSKSRGWMIHREDCSQLAHLENRERLTRISWKDVEKNWQNFGTVVRIQVRNQVGVLGEISSVFARQNKRIESMDVKPHRAEAEIRIKFSVKDREDVERVIREISFLPDVIRVERE